MIPEPEIIVKQTARVAVVMNLLRQLGILIGGGVTIAALVGRRDMRGLVDLLQSEALLPIVGAAVFVASSAGSVWKTVHNEWVKRTLARSAPIGQVKGEEP